MPTITAKTRTFLELAAMPWEAFLHLENSPVWEEGDHVAAPMGYWAYKHTGCGEIVHVPSSGYVGSDNMLRAVMDICMTEILADADATDEDRWALIYHLSGIVRIPRVSQWMTHQALGYIRTLSEMRLAANDEGPDNEHDGSLPSFRNC